MTPSQLKARIEDASRFFSRENMKFSGDSMRNYGVRTTVARTNWTASGEYVEGDGVTRTAWELYRKRATCRGMKSSAYFDAETFQQIHGVKG